MRAAIVALAVLLMGAGVAEAAGGRADLLERAPVLSGARVVEPGDTLVVTDAVKNTGRRRARAARTRFLLSRDALPGADDLVLGERRTPRLRRRRTSRRVVTLIVPAAVEPGAWTLIACADATRRVRERRERDNCRAALLGLRVPAPPPPPLPPAPAPPPAQVPRAIEPPPAPDPEPPPQPTGRAAIEDCDPSVADAEDPAGAFTAMFAATTLGWTGGDSTLSAMLPGGEVAWVFGDSFLGGLEGDGRDRPYPDIRNALVVQDDRCLTTLFRGTLDDPTAFELTEDDEQWYWGNQPVVHGDEVRIFWTRMRPEGDLYAVDGVALGTYDADLDRVAIDRDVPALEGQWWGAAFADDATHTYVFGIRDQPRGVFLARTPLHDLDGEWEYRAAAGWSDDLADAEPVLEDGAEISTQLSVVPDGDEWALVSQEALGRDVNVWRSDDLITWGPRATLTTLPEIEDGRSYNAGVHPEFTDAGGDLLLSYNVIADSPQLSQADAGLYRPRFTRVALPQRSGTR